MTEGDILLHETAFYKLDKLVWEMRQSKTGLLMKQQKTFFSTIQSASTGRELIQWIQKRLNTDTDAEAAHIANLLSKLGYIVLVPDRQLLLKPETCCRIQRPGLWISRNCNNSSNEYASYLLKRFMKGKCLEAHELSALHNLEMKLSEAWPEIKRNAKEAVKKYEKATKLDREIEDAQEKLFWRVHKPPPTQKQFQHLADDFKRNAVSMEHIAKANKVEILRKKINFMKFYLVKTQNQTSSSKEKTINLIVSHHNNYAEFDPMLEKKKIFNPWIEIDEFLYDDLIEMEEERPTKRDCMSWSINFRDLLKDPLGKQLFSTFLRQEYSLENIRFWSACEELKSCPLSQLESRLAKIESLYKTNKQTDLLGVRPVPIQRALEKLKKTPEKPKAGKKSFDFFFLSPIYFRKTQSTMRSSKNLQNDGIGFKMRKAESLSSLVVSRCSAEE